MSNIAPLPFQGDLIEYIRVHETAIQWLWKDGEAFIPVRPICDVLGIAYSPQRRKLQGPDSRAVVTMMVTTGADGKRYEMLCVAYPDFMMWLGGLTVSRVKEEARAATIATQDEIKTVIATYYHDRVFGQIEDTTQTLQKLRLDAMFRKPLRGRVVQAVKWGWDFETLWRSGSASRPRLIAAIKECLALGLIEKAPEGTPFEMAQGAIDQADLFAEG